MAYHARGRLPHLSPPSAYYDPGQYALEQARVFATAWRFVGTLDEIPAHGDFLTRTIAGLPLILRNLKGEVRAFSNVCAHRHCLLRRNRYGKAELLTCPYHGWVYDWAGKVKRAREPQLFQPPPDGPNDGRPALARYRTALCGRLIFVRLSQDGSSLQEFMGELYDLIAERFGDDWRPSLRLDVDYRANWKVAVENALESYHGAELHRRTFGGDPGEARSEHRLEPGWTQFSTKIEIRQRLAGRIYCEVEDSLLRFVGETPTATYRHFHLFPNLTFSLTDTVSYVQCMEPVSPTGSDGLIRQFTLSRRRWSPWRRGLLALWGAASARLTRRIVGEDMAIYPDLQRGLEGSQQAGLLGRNEERIHAFQAWLRERLAASPTDP
ncbi:MAG: hypothetical protein B7Y99_04190 [Caulobacterales bacterium 32-69-10]|nr:MAG: hypothetical protein B7Y99_04190 [Caulobacterales bacterium 32-69-10]